MEKVQNCSIFNYGDDNTIFPFHNTFVGIEAILKQSCNVMISLFSDNWMQTNPSKFHCIFFGSSGKETVNIVTGAVDCVKLLRIDTARNPSFTSHITQISKKAGKQSSKQAV